MLVTIYIDTENQRPTKQLHRYGYVLEAAGKTAEGFGEADETFSGTVLTALLAAVSRIRTKCELKIVLRNCRIGQDLTENAEKWKKQGWIRGSGKPVKNAELWKQLLDQLHKLGISEITYDNSMRHSYSSWIQGEIKRKIIA